MFLSLVLVWTPFVKNKQTNKQTNSAVQSMRTEFTAAYTSPTELAVWIAVREVQIAMEKDL